MSVEYPVILADPPWHFETWGEGDRNVTKYYPIMPTVDICAMQPPATDDCALFLWACWPKLLDAMQVIEAWGFTYRTVAWVWVKLNESSMGTHVGMGYYTRANTEPCLLAVRGRMPVKHHDVQALIMTPVQAHSRKPDDQYRKIERLYDGPYLEMFARRKGRPNWSYWGNEVESDVTIGSR